MTLKSKLIFQEFRHGNDRKRKPNIITIEQDGADRLEFEEPIICVGRSAKNDLVFEQMSVSRRHCVLINYAEDVWLHDLGSTHGTYIDGVLVESPVVLEGRCRVSVGDNELTVLPKEGILL
ncbi:MAG: FHA domain-containing protein [Pseudomonadota bacterium]